MANIILWILGIVVLAAVLAALGFVIYLSASPMPVVKFLRKMPSAPPEYPPEHYEAKKRVKIKKDLEYPSAYPYHTYDLYRPYQAGEEGAPQDAVLAEGKTPLLLWVHGGAFVAGDKDGIENWGVMLAARGYAVAAINYVWAPEEKYPVQILQTAEAMQEMIRIAEKENLDMSRVTVAGDSAGAYIAMQFALCHTNPKLANRLEITSPLEKDALKAALLYCGPFDIKKVLTIQDRKMKFLADRIGWSFLGKKNWRSCPLIDTVTPMDFVTEETVPCYITDGNYYSFENHGRALGEALREKGVEVKERYFPKEEGQVNHEYEIPITSEPARLCFADSVEFLEMVMKSKER